ncbi:MAG: tetratricopeptide repeat protein [Candidatus Rokubacteria bacterium]|nr:tetratricopeptide repeat protein [Candidatus Rokubacteria bacterium]
MRSRLAFLAVLGFAALVTSLTLLNPHRVTLRLTPGLSLEPPLIAVVLGAFVIGAAISVLLSLIRDLGRTVAEWRAGERAAELESVERLYHDGVAALLRGETDRAGDLFRAILRREPSHREALIHLGDLAHRAGRYGEALGHHQKAVELREDVPGLLTLVEDLRLLGRPAEALVALERALARERSPALLAALRDLAVEERQWAAALRAQQELVRLARDPEARRAEHAWLAALHYETGKALLAAGQAAEAAGALREALKADRGFAPASLALAEAYERSGDHREAVRTLERAVEHHPAVPLLQRLEAHYREAGRPSRMIELYQDALARYPGDLALGFHLARVYYELGMLDEAADQFQKAEVQAPALPAVHGYLALIAAQRGEPTALLAEARRALQEAGALALPHRCQACQAGHAGWVDRCPACGRWNAVVPSP